MNKECPQTHEKGILGIAVESTNSGYWMVDMLREKGYKVHLANP